MNVTSADAERRNQGLDTEAKPARDHNKSVASAGQVTEQGTPTLYDSVFGVIDPSRDVAAVEPDNLQPALKRRFEGQIAVHTLATARVSNSSSDSPG